MDRPRPAGAVVPETDLDMTASTHYPPHGRCKPALVSLVLTLCLCLPALSSLFGQPTCAPVAGGPPPVFSAPATPLVGDLDFCDGEDLVTIVLNQPAIDICGLNLLTSLELPAGADLDTARLDSARFSISAPAGQYTLTVSATDAAGNQVQRTLTLFVNAAVQPAGPATEVCVDLINVTLNDGCDALVVPEMVLPVLPICAEWTDYRVRVLDGSQPADGLIDGTGDFIYELLSVDAITGDSTPACWGNVSAYDDGQPVAPLCPAATDSLTITENVQILSGNIPASAATLSASSLVCVLPPNQPIVPSQAFDTLSFIVNTDGSYLLELDSDWGGGQGAVYSGTFNPADPCLGLFATASAPLAGAAQPRPRLNVYLRAGVRYTLLTLTGQLSAQGQYRWSVRGLDGGRIAGLPLAPLTYRRALLTTDFGEAPLNEACYELDETGNLISPLTTAQQQLLNRLGRTGYPGQGGNPGPVDACGGTTVCVTDLLLPPGDCPDGAVPVLRRTFVFTDQAGNASSCEQLLSARVPDLSDLVLPPARLVYGCDYAGPVDENGVPAAPAQIFPLVPTPTGFTPLTGSYGNLAVAVINSSQEETCGDGLRATRIFNFFDWCQTGVQVSRYQLVELRDRSAPVFGGLPNALGEDFRVSNDTLYIGGFWNNCRAGLFAPLPQVTDDCGTVTTQVRVTDPFDPDPDFVLAGVNLSPQNRILTDLPNQPLQITYEFTDECGNRSAISYILIVQDRQPPQANCTDGMRVSLNGNGPNTVVANDFNVNSFDGCGGVTLAVRRFFTDSDCTPTAEPTAFGPTVAFDCCDLNSEVMVELRVTDQRNNSAICWLLVEVEDKIAPLCQTPADRTIFCTALATDFDVTDTTSLNGLFGSAPLLGTDCTDGVPAELTALDQRGNCGIGQIIRRFRYTDPSGNQSPVCQQIINVMPRHDYAIRFPADGEGQCGQIDADSIRVYENSCDLLAVSVSESRVNVAAGACFKLDRTYEVINWCEYDGFSDPLVIGRDEDCDQLAGDEAVWLVRRPFATAIDRDSLIDNQIPAAGTGCDNPAGMWRQVDPTGYYRYRQLIKVVDTIPPVIVTSQQFPYCITDLENCSREIEFRFFITEECTPDSLEIEILFDEGRDSIFDFSLTENNPFVALYPKFTFTDTFFIGEHSIRIIVRDGCGNVSIADIPFSVVDCTGPSPICIAGLTGTLSSVPAGTDADGDGTPDLASVAIWAQDFVASDVTDCSGPVEYSINRVGEPAVYGQTGLTFTCDHIGYQEVEIHAWDQADNPYIVNPDGTTGGRNHEYCTTYILIQDDNNFDWCPGPDASVNLGGNLVMADGSPVAQTAVYLVGPLERDTLSTSTGTYMFDQLGVGADWEILPVKADDWLVGVSTLDIVLITRHILGIQELTANRALLAADVNASGSISTLDLVHIRRAILGFSGWLSG